MSSTGGLTASSLSPDLSFNWIFLVELIVCGILTLFFLFYFNRLFATIVSYILRAYTWHKFRVYIDIQALQISPLAGRVFFKGLRYHGNNETILVQSGFITWTYWLRNVRGLDLAQESDKESESCEKTASGPVSEEKGGIGLPQKFPCRLNVELKGLEWFIYNRIPAYDSIVAGLAQPNDSSNGGVTVGQPDVEGVDPGFKRRNDHNGPDKLSGPNSLDTEKSSSLRFRAEKDAERESSHDRNRLSSNLGDGLDKEVENGLAANSILLFFQPIHLLCTKAAIVIGNENTKSVLITKAESFSGDIDASRCRKPDIYKQIFNFKLNHPVIQIKPNDDYKEDQTAAANRAKDGLRERTTAANSDHKHRKFWTRYRRRTWHTLQNLVPYFRSSIESFLSMSTGVPDPYGNNGEHDHSHHWQGLSRYLDSEQDDKVRWSTFEYATVSTILDSPEASISYYWDIPGNISYPSSRSKTRSNGNINGDLPPEWGIDLMIKGAIVNYGPWADRQRAELQRVFFPSLCKDAIPARALKFGETRVATNLKIYIQLDEETVLRIPIREESKNWKWKAQAEAMESRINEQKQRQQKASRRKKRDKVKPGPEIRPFGWFDLKMGANATINYNMDMVAGSSGFSNTLEVDLPDVEITTSVNHGLLWKSQNQQVLCDLSNPLAWNGLRTWKFDISSTGLELFILREHIFLLIDLVDDWSSGPPPEFLTFSPFRYLMNLSFGDFKLYLNANDANIINDPSDFDDNVFLTIFGEGLKADVCIPLDKFRPYRNDITFDMNAHTGGLKLQVPPWNTQATFLPSNELALLKDLHIGGKYQYCDTTSTSNTDTLLLDVCGKSLEVQLFGFLIRYIMKIKDNYFGEDIHFKTLEEYQQSITGKNADIPGAVLNTPPHKKSNDLDVILSISAENSTALLPANLYSAENYIRIEITQLRADLRFTNYYMDLDLSLSPLALSSSSGDGGSTPSSSTSGIQMFIDGVDVYGTRLFGLPPTEPTYLCNWDFSVGNVTGECSSEFILLLVAGLRAFVFSFDDDENALPSINPLILHDSTFLRASIEGAHVWMHVEEDVFLVSTDAIMVTFNDWAVKAYSRKLNVQIPNLTLACVDAESASRHRTRKNVPVETHAYFTTTINITMVSRKHGFGKDKSLQQKHIEREDSRTHRTPFLLHDDWVDEGMVLDINAVDPPAMCFPSVPEPLDANSTLFIKETSSASAASTARSWRRSLRHKSSFLSTTSRDSGSQKSIVRTHSNISVPKLRTPRSTHIPSRSGHRDDGRLHTAHMRDVSAASTGRQSSFYSAVADHCEATHLSPHHVSFSSAFMHPYFPLDLVEPDTKNVPEDILNGNDEVDAIDTNLGNINERHFEDDVVYTSFILELNNGIRTYCNPEAVRAVRNMLEVMQPVKPDDILDNLQITTMGDVFARAKQKVRAGQNTDLSIIIPAIQVRFTNSSARDEYFISHQPFDQYDLAIRGLSIIARLGTAIDNLAPDSRVKESSALAIRLHSAQASAKERFDEMDETQAAINARINDVVFWMTSSDKISGSLNLNVVEIAMASSKVEYLATLVHRTAELASQSSQEFSSLQSQQENRIKLFTYLLSTTTHHTPDPLFLTRPSYVLRSATGHLRITDSWKAITRLRHVFASLDPTAQNDIAERCGSNIEYCPGNMRQQVLDGLERWRSWDLDNVKESLLVQKIFGTLDENSKVAGEKPVHAAFGIAQVIFILDPGPKQNEISLDTLAGKVSIIPSSAGHNQANTTRVPYKATIVQLHFVDVSINLNWELCELAGNILRLYNHSDNFSEMHTQAIACAPDDTQKSEHHMHFVLAVENGSITLETINMLVTSLSTGLKMSFFVIDGQIDGSSKGTILLAADGATSKIRSPFEDLVLYQLRHPVIYVCRHAQLAHEKQEISWQAAGNCEELICTVKKNPLVLLETVDLLVVDELSQVYELSEILPAKSSLQTVSNSSSFSTANKIDVSLFLGKYLISVPLLHSLHYDINGEIARASVSLRRDVEVIVDFDIKEQSHVIQTRSNGDMRKIPVLKMPPTNGRITTHMSRSETTVTVFTSIEPIHLDAAAIQSLLSALNRPEISSVFTEIRESLQNIQKRIGDVLKSDQTPPRVEMKESSKSLIYEGHLVLAGFEIHADTPNDKSGLNTTRLSFNLGSIHMEAANRLDSQGPALQFPEATIILQHVIFDLSCMTDREIIPCGNFAFAARLTASSNTSENGDVVRSYLVHSDALEINLFAETASTVVNMVAHLQDRIKDLDLSREVQYFQRLRKPRIKVSDDSEIPENVAEPIALFESMYSLELTNLQISWIVNSVVSDQEGEKLVLSLHRVDLSTRKKNSARLTIENLQLEMVPSSYSQKLRSPNSALLPEIIFNIAYVSTQDASKLAFQAVGKSVDIRLTSQFILPAANLKRSIETAIEKVQAASASWALTPASAKSNDEPRKPFFGKKRLESLLVDVDFAGAVVHLSGPKPSDGSLSGSLLRPGQTGRYNQFSQDETGGSTMLRAPGLAWKIEYKDNGIDDPSLHAEVRVDASTNTLYPTVVPLIMDITTSIKALVSEQDDPSLLEKKVSAQTAQKLMRSDDENILVADPSAVLGRMRLNLGLRICAQEFSLSCQPIARVAATARFDDIYATISTVRSIDHGNFFAISAAITRLQTSVQHVYSRESTGSFEVESIVLSLMNSKHVSGTSGVSAILKVSPMNVLVNAKQLQDFLLFRDIWVPAEIRQAPNGTPPPQPTSTATSQTHTYLVQRYQQVASTGAFPWNATVSIEELNVQLDLGQAIGKSVFMISKFWISSKKNSDWEQNLCIGFDKVGIDSSGRMSGFVSLQNFRIRSSIRWPEREKALNQTPLVQGSIGFSQFRVKVAFDYQAFLVADITSFEFLMYNVRNGRHAKGDRLVARLDGDSVQVFCTTTSASQALALYQAFQKLIQEKQTNYEASLKEVERFMKRKSSAITPSQHLDLETPQEHEKLGDSPITLHNDVVVTLRAVNIGAFPSTFFDQQVFKLEALNAQFRFAVAMADRKIHSGLGLTLGQLRIGLASVKSSGAPKPTSEISVEEVVSNATGSRGGTILKVPKVEATMETWQTPGSNHIDYIFKSSFEGKVEVGWNYSRISYIRGMYGNHERTLAQRLGKPLPFSAVKITGVPQPDEDGKQRQEGEQQKITAEVTVPLSKYDYSALEPPIIETPQLRDMGEATPPLEWIGLHRDRLPNLTHQIVIVPLLELAGEVEDAYAKILGSS